MDHGSHYQPAGEVMEGYHVQGFCLIECPSTQLFDFCSCVPDHTFELVDHRPFSPNLILIHYRLFPQMKVKKETHLAANKYRSNGHHASAVDGVFFLTNKR